MKDFIKTFAEVQQRHAKRMLKIAEAVDSAKSEASFAMLDMLVDEEFQKRREDKISMMGTLMDSGGHFKGTAMIVLLCEITDDTVVHFLKQQITRLKESHDIQTVKP